MTRISLSQATTYARNAGFRGLGLATIVAIAEAESGLDTTAVNRQDPNGGSFGILQINGSHNQPTSVTFDPQQSFAYAYHLSRGGTDFRPWSTYISGAYKQTNAWRTLTMPMSEQPTPASTDATAFGFGPLDAIGSFLSDIAGAISWIGNPVRVFKMLAGIGLILTAIVLLVGDNMETVAKVASKVGLEVET